MDKFTKFALDDPILEKAADIGFFDKSGDLLLGLDQETKKRIYGFILDAALDAHLVQRVIDEPDEKPTESIEGKYTLKRLPDGKLWMMENLREPVEGAVWNEEYNCYMYTWEQAMKAVPEGFHLPSASEFMFLAEKLGYGVGDDKKVVEKLQNECDFKMTGTYEYCDDGGFYHQGSHACYWSSTQHSDWRAYYLNLFVCGILSPASYNDKNRGFAVRCIKDEEKEEE